ncbi:hypothetical protein FO519_007167 [Halicephalobus sp. NKZ332]|nr:hypothetical protein FO519_007167 [Halicephalobus sp. NKZ332]
MSNPVEVQISSDELAVYDRQIRLWGLDAQNRLRNSTALIYGMSLLGAEVAKNLMLCGLNKLVIADAQNVGKEKTFLIDPSTSENENRAVASEKAVKVLNPMVKLEAKKLSPDELKKEFLIEFDLVILIDQREDLIKSVDNICRELKIRFISGGIFGWTGYAFFDFNGFDFIIPAPKNHALVDEEKDENPQDGPSPSKKIKVSEKFETITLEEDDAKITKKFEYPSFEKSIFIDPKKLTKGILRRAKPANFLITNALLFLGKSGKEITKENIHEFLEKSEKNLQEIVLKALNDEIELVLDPPFPATCSIVGGVLSQEAIKALSQNETPHKNYFAYNAVDSMGYVYDLPLINWTVYGAAKSALDTWTKYEAQRLAKLGVRINNINPGPFLTNQIEKAIPQELPQEEREKMKQKKEDLIAENTVFGRFGDMKELTPAYLLLADNDRSGYTTGSCWTVDGGMSYYAAE